MSDLPLWRGELENQGYNDAPAIGSANTRQQGDYLESSATTKERTESMRRTFTSLEMSLMLCVVVMTTAAVYGAISCSRLADQADAWRSAYTNAVYHGGGR